MDPQECLLKPGQTVNVFGPHTSGIQSSYKVVKKLGEGGFGVVYLVNSDANNKPYALKVLKLWLLKKNEQDNYKKRFNRAYKVMSASSEHLIHSVDFGEINGNPFYVMEYCPDGDLLCHFGKYDSLNTEKEVVRCMYQVLLGLRELHSQGMVHRDIKPENVMIRPDGIIVLNDFDLAGDENNRFTTQYIMGIPRQSFYTKAFAPPEQVNPIRGKKEVMVMPTIDIFAFAVMTFQLLIGTFPFGSIRTDSDMAVYYARANNDEWDRDALQRTNNADFWLKVLEPCLKGNYQKRLGDVNQLITWFETRFPEISDKKSSSKDYPPMSDYGLTILYGKYGHPHELLNFGKSLLTIGRHANNVNNDVEIFDDENRYVSRRHATLEWDKNDRHWYIRDGQYDNQSHSWCRSKNGTYVNSHEVDDVRGVRLEVDDIIYIGETRIGVVGFDKQGWMYSRGERLKNPIWT